MCPYYEIKAEYRTIILDNEVKVLYGKKRPIVIGDDKSTKKELLLKFNENYFKKQNLDNSYNEILPKNTEFIYNWQFNLSQGANIFLVKNEKISTKIENLALTISKKLGIRFCSIDIIETVDNNFLIMEANSGVMMDNFIELYPSGYDIAFKIYEEAVLKMFE